jgi:hypothetical protein
MSKKKRFSRGVAAAVSAGEQGSAARQGAAMRLAGGALSLFALGLLASAGCSLVDTSDIFAPADAAASGSAASGSGGAGGTGGESSSAGGTGSGSGGATSSSTGGPPGPIAICINEIMPDNQTSLVVMGATPEWIELHNPTDMAVDLEGWSLTDDESQPKLSVLPKGLTLPPKGFVLLYADGDTKLGPEHLAFKLNAGGGKVGLFSPDGAGSVVPYGMLAADVSAALVPDCCTGSDCTETDFQGTPGKSNVPVVLETVTVLPEGSVYRYLDTGSAPPATWIDADFDDSSWKMGAAPLGYEDAHIVTTVSYGFNANNKFITTWIRTTFEVTDAASVASAKVELMRDDGARAFLNGVEVARSNLPQGAITATTLASASVSGGQETSFFSFDVDPSLFVEGTNVLAVEVHQSSGTSSDLGVDARVTVEQPAP